MKSAKTAIGEQGRKAISLMAQEVCQGVDASRLHFKVGNMATPNALGVEAVHSLGEYARGANSASLWGVESWEGSGDAGLDVGDRR